MKNGPTTITAKGKAPSYSHQTPIPALFPLKPSSLTTASQPAPSQLLLPKKKEEHGKAARLLANLLEEGGENVLKLGNGCR